MTQDPSRSISEVLEGARAGKPEDVDRLFDACRSYLGLVARAQVESWMKAKVDASDLVQQTLLEAHRDFARFEGKTEAEWLAWLRRILSHNAGDFIRRFRGSAKRQVNREVGIQRPGDDSQAGGAPEPQAQVDSPSQALIRQEAELRVADALAELPADYQEVIMLRNLQRLEFNEVARLMGRSRPAVQMLWMRAIKKLQEVVGTGENGSAIWPSGKP
jgi:RNA polymerase sigma-70 factor, ECF subfamily